MSAASEAGESDDRFRLIGQYTPRDADRFLSALEDAKIEFEIECDDGIRFGSLPGSFGQNAKVRVFVDRARVQEAMKVQTGLFGQ